MEHNFFNDTPFASKKIDIIYRATGGIYLFSNAYFYHYFVNIRIKITSICVMFVLIWMTANAYPKKYLSIERASDSVQMYELPPSNISRRFQLTHSPGLSSPLEGSRKIDIFNCSRLQICFSRYLFLKLASCEYVFSSRIIR